MVYPHRGYQVVILIELLAWRAMTHLWRSLQLMLETSSTLGLGYCEA